MNLTKHETDFYAWALDQARYLKKGDVVMIDYQNISEELESLGINQENKLESYLEVLMLHLLKWKYQENLRSKSWKLSILNSMYQIKRVLQKNPSLKYKIDERMKEVYVSARYNASIQTSYDLKVFPKECPWTFEQLMEENSKEEDLQ